MAGNQLHKIGHILSLQKLKFLHNLDLRGNPLCEIDDYRELVIFLLPKLTMLDNQEVTPEDTVQVKGYLQYIVVIILDYRIYICKSPNKASNLFQPNSDLCAALDHMTHTVYGILEGTELFINYTYNIYRGPIL